MYICVCVCVCVCVSECVLECRISHFIYLFKYGAYKLIIHE